MVVRSDVAGRLAKGGRWPLGAGIEIAVLVDGSTTWICGVAGPSALKLKLIG
jgi:hypothetical protein